MPCEPRLMRPDDDDNLQPGDPDMLPADLELLAEQLMLDARFLEERYPAGVRHSLPEQQVAPAATAARYRITWFRVAALVIAAVGIASASQIASNWRQADVGQSTALSHNVPDVSTTRAVNSDRNGSAEVTPALFFGDLSGPEREAWLDLLEDEAFSPSSLSI